MMSRRFLILMMGALALAGCRGMESGKPPIHPNTNMDFQQRLDPQEPFSFFADNSAMRMPVAGTVARGMLREDASFYQGRTAPGGGFVARMPVPATRELLQRGRTTGCSPAGRSATPSSALPATASPETETAS